MVDEHLRVREQPNIFAAGDAASLEAALNVPIRMACATAGPMGSYLGDYLAAVLQGKRDLPPFRFRYLLRCISLGRQAALVQFVDAHDRPKERILTGRAGALVKELVCKATLWAPNIDAKLASRNFHRRSKTDRKQDASVEQLPA